jgi:hypothetical protein
MLKVIIQCYVIFVGILSRNRGDHHRLAAGGLPRAQSSFVPAF